MIITFVVPSIPIAQPRQRQRVIASGGRAFAHNYTPTNSPVNAFKAAVQFAAANAYSGPPLDCPLQLAATFVFPRPKAMRWKMKPMPRLWQAGKPDVDNLMKSVSDALNGVLYVDDSRIVSAILRKQIAAGDEQPHCVITITELNTDAAGGAG